MSSGARSLVYKQYERALAQWPKSTLRPDAQFQDVLAKRLEAQVAAGKAVDEQSELKQVNALYSLLENRYKLKYRVSERIFAPRSNPTYYSDLVTELEEAPQRSWLGRVAKRVGGMIRLS